MRKASCRTDAVGTCSLMLARISLSVPSVTFAVTSVTSSVGAYDAGRNSDPDGDSDGTTIVIAR